MPNSPPQVIHMPLEDLMDPELKFDCPESAGENPTAYVLKSDVDKMAEALKELTGGAPYDETAHGAVFQRARQALAAYRKAKGGRVDD